MQCVAQTCEYRIDNSKRTTVTVVRGRGGKGREPLGGGRNIWVLPAKSISNDNLGGLSVRTIQWIAEY